MLDERGLWTQLERLPESDLQRSARLARARLRPSPIRVALAQRRTDPAIARPPEPRPVGRPAGRRATRPAGPPAAVRAGARR